MAKKNKNTLNLIAGKRIKTFRSGNGWTQEYIANRLSISIPAFSKIENGVTDVNLSRLEQIAHLFEVDVVNLLAEKHESAERPLTLYDIVQKKLAEADAMVFDLQNKVIELYAELHGNKPNLSGQSIGP